MTSLVTLAVARTVLVSVTKTVDGRTDTLVVLRYRVEVVNIVLVEVAVSMTVVSVVATDVLNLVALTVAVDVAKTVPVVVLERVTFTLDVWGIMVVVKLVSKSMVVIVTVV